MDTTHAIDTTLVRPSKRAASQVRSGNVEDVLADAITTAGTTLTSAAAGDDPWFLERSTVEIVFGVTKASKISHGLDSGL